MNETKLLQDLENYTKLEDVEKFFLIDDLEMENIPATALDLTIKHTRDLISQVLQGRFGVDVDTNVYCELDKLAREPKIKLTGANQYEVIAGGGVLELNKEELLKLKNLLNNL